MTPKQIRTLQTARRSLDLGDPQYRMILRNTGGVESSRDLSHRAFEQVMAVMEEMGFQNPKSPTYWRDKAQGGGTRQSLTSAERMRYKVQALARQCATYPLGAMVRRHSDGRTDVLDELDNRELWNLIEAYKGILARQERAARQGNLFDSTPAAEGSAPGAVREGPARTPATARDGDRMGRGRGASYTAEPPARTKTAATTSPGDVFGGGQPDDDIPF